MVWLWIFVGALVLVLFTPLLIGLFLGEDFRGAAAMEVEAAPQAVWDAVLDYARHPTCATSCRGVRDAPEEGKGEGLPAWVEDLGPTQLTVQVAEMDAPRRLALHIQDSVVPLSSDWTLRIEPKGGGSRVALESETKIRRGTWHVPIFRFMMGPVGGVQKGVVHYLRTLAKSLGEQPEITGPESFGGA
jgi:hypothetical protein